MKYILCFIIAATFAVKASAKKDAPKFFKADDRHISYTGRIDFSNPAKPRFWAAGVYIQAKFKGTSLTIFLNDEESGDNRNYIEVVIDDNKPFRIKLTKKVNELTVADDLAPGEHTVTICKDTESGIGYIDFLGMKCEKLLPVKKPHHKIEFIGDSITCGSGIDESDVKCDMGKWYDQHNAYLSYGPLTARQLDAQYYLSSVSGIGLIHSCCNISLTMPQAFDKMNQRLDTIQWDFSRYTPDVVTICLGQNDGKQDSARFCSAYVTFIGNIHSHYPKADIVCLNSPMGNEELTAMLKRYIPAIANAAHASGDKKVSYYFFSGRYNDGCGGHPGMAQHQLIADQLAGYIKGLEKW